MVRAAQTDQKALLDLQSLDTTLAKLAHERRNLPVLTTLTDLADHRATLDSERVRHSATLSDEGREQARVEGEIELVRARAARHQERLQSAGARDAQALQSEIEHLAVRTSALEDEELVVMERVEAVELQLAQVTTALESIAERVAEAEVLRDAEFARIDEQSAAARGKRDELAAKLPADLINLYEKVRERTGGLGAVGLHGQRSEPVQLDFSLTELADIKAAAADEVVLSDEHGYIIVRLD